MVGLWSWTTRGDNSREMTSSLFHRWISYWNFGRTILPCSNIVVNIYYYAVIRVKNRHKQSVLMRTKYESRRERNHWNNMIVRVNPDTLFSSIVSRPYILELLIWKSNMSVAPVSSNESIMAEESFFLTSADTATATKQWLRIFIHTWIGCLTFIAF